MRIVLVLACLPLLSGCVDVGSVSDLMAGPPSATYVSNHDPDRTLSDLALAADPAVGRVEYVDSAARLLVASNKHFMTGERMLLVAARTEPDGSGSKVTVWAKPARGWLGDPFADRLWKAYLAREAQPSAQP